MLKKIAQLELSEFNFDIFEFTAMQISAFLDNNIFIIKIRNLTNFYFQNKSKRKKIVKIRISYRNNKVNEQLDNK